MNSLHTVTRDNPDDCYASFASVWPDHGDFRSSPVNGHSQDRRACLKGAMNGSRPVLFDQGIGDRKQRCRDVNSKRPGGLQVDYEFQPCGLLEREITGLLTLYDAI